MNPGNDIVKELEELNSPLAHMPRVMPFQLPGDYFTTFAQQLEDAISYEDEPELNLPKELPFALPEGYFEGLAASIMDKVQEAPAFGVIQPAAFEVPSGYFQQLPQQIMTVVRAAEIEATIQQKTTKVIPFVPRKVVQWAAAACLIAAIGLGGYKIMNQPQPLSAEKQLAQLNKDDIRNYVAHHLDEFDTEMLAESSPVLSANPEKSIHKLNKEDIQEYLDEGGI